MASAYNDVSAEPDTVVLIHGLWLTPRCWEQWVGYYADAGFHVATPAWPGMEIEVESLRENPSVASTFGINVRLFTLFAFIVSGVFAGLAGALFAFITSLDNVPVTIFLISANQTTLPVLIFSSVEMGVDPSVAAVSTLLIVATGIVLLLAERRAGFHRFV